MENITKKGRKTRSKDFDSVFASRLRKLLNERETTQQQLSEGITATRQAINKWVNGETVPDVIAAAEIAKYFGVSVDYLLGLTENKNAEENQKTDKIPLSYDYVAVFSAGALRGVQDKLKAFYIGMWLSGRDEINIREVIHLTNEIIDDS